VRHLTQRGRSICASELSVEDEVMRLTLIRRELDTLGHRQLPKDKTVIAKLKSAPGIRLSGTRHTGEGILFRNLEPFFIAKVLGTKFSTEASFLARRCSPPGWRRAFLPERAPLQRPRPVLACEANEVAERRGANSRRDRWSA
jgi:hypothetical protein